MSKLIHETKYWSVFLLENQYYLGRSIVELKREAKQLSDLTSDESVDFFELVKVLESNLKKSFNTTNFNWTCMMNNAQKDSNNETPQVHWHLWPRYKDKVIVNGETFEDEVFAHHYDKYKEKSVKPETFEEIKNMILVKI